MVASELIAVDWGTTNFRGFRLTGGEVVERREAPHGILQVAGGAFEQAFEDQLGNWLRAAPHTPVIMSGMIGSRQGWSEAPYKRCPAGLDQLAELHAFETRAGRRISIVPGLTTTGATGVHDVIRGEETQVIGLLSASVTDRRLFCLPGTHAKWVAVEGEIITDFFTAMTGEVFSVLVEHSILGRLMTGDDTDDAAFDRGLARAGEPGGLLHHLFGVRTEGLFGAVLDTGLRSYLSGILIGHDVRGARAHHPDTTSVTIIAASRLAPLYRRALVAAGAAVAMVDGEAAAVQGLWSLAIRAGLVQATP